MLVSPLASVNVGNPLPAKAEYGPRLGPRRYLHLCLAVYGRYLYLRAQCRLEEMGYTLRQEPDTYEGQGVVWGA